MHYTVHGEILEQFRIILSTYFMRCTRNTGCLYKLSQINLVWGQLKCTKSNFNPVHFTLHFGTFYLTVWQLILPSKLSELEQFEFWTENCEFANKIEFSGKSLHPRTKCKKGDPLKFNFTTRTTLPNPKHLF